MKYNIQKIRQSEKKYHDNLYKNNTLFEGNTWLSKPIKKVIDYFDYLTETKKGELKILDLGVGIGRHCIPILQIAKSKNIYITYYCVDILDSAIEHLKINLEKYGLSKNVKIIKSDVEKFDIQEDFFDYIISVSCIEHISNKDSFYTVLENIQKGTKKGGLNCFFINCDVNWIDTKTNTQVAPQIEINFTKDELHTIFENMYKQWNTLFLSCKKWTDSQMYLGKNISFESTCFMCVIEK